MDFEWLNLPAPQAARELLGCRLVSTIGDGRVEARIVEVEAYDQNDPASHTFKGQTPRNKAMFLSAGHAYVYLSYGIHHCLNVVCGQAGFGAGVLVRAVEPLVGLEVVAARRPTARKEWTNGPGKVCQALGVDLSLTGHDLCEPPLQLKREQLRADERILETTRIGISKAAEVPHRFYISEHPDASRRDRAAERNLRNPSG
ncbi:DNA-3-methyladenine glycosylase [Gleimia hominis]|uniref:DNA-3-methyladenine glycosylase n=1 Tax=Gleimia hominis TaxID=595468 RepID=UPI000C7FE06E|nr:DNA-3-methyladenine glycosylase [Gleimia hominis]WIK63895.1 DNA-3-methyladenine glycosylase [Gleimia hominis]